MRVGICAGFGDPLPDADWHLLYELGFAGIRQDIPNVQSAALLVSNMVGRGSTQHLALMHCRGTVDHSLALAEDIAVCIKATGQTGTVALEIGNEEDINGRWRDDPIGYGHLVASITDLLAVVNPHLRVVTGGIGSVSRDALEWLAAAIPYVPGEVAVGFHPYRTSPPGIPGKGYSSREAEYAALREVAGSRPLWLTEVGWHTAPRPRDFPLCFTSWRYSDGEVAAFLREEMRLASRQGVEAAYVFQLNDGPKNEPEGRFGIRKQDGTLKPGAAVAREWDR